MRAFVRVELERGGCGGFFGVNQGQEGVTFQAIAKMHQVAGGYSLAIDGERRPRSYVCVCVSRMVMVIWTTNGPSQ